MIDAAISKDDDSQGGIGYYVIVNILDIVFGILAGMVLMAHSRKREFKADEGGARYTSKAKMIAGLKKLMQIYDNPVPRDGFATMKFSGRQAL